MLGAGKDGFLFWVSENTHQKFIEAFTLETLAPFHFESKGSPCLLS
jgi:galactokinase/mevalonate kinase-like predicted kinase